MHNFLVLLSKREEYYTGAVFSAKLRTLITPSCLNRSGQTFFCSIGLLKAQPGRKLILPYAIFRAGYGGKFKKLVLQNACSENKKSCSGPIWTSFGYVVGLDEFSGAGYKKSISVTVDASFGGKFKTLDVYRNFEAG